MAKVNCTCSGLLNDPFCLAHSMKKTVESKQMERVDVDHHLKNLAGRVLTVVDSVMPEGRQKDAFKSLVKKEFREEFNRVRDWFAPPNCSEGLRADEDLFGKDHVRSLL